ncbi:MAG: metalloregulator ArsR/SmtB family transcription factor [Polyangiaceae bacterium]|jgi:ubiquinone/menaquinone biosynthesis C-methylase UbiE/DNA-binding transcriptional ArsR family regulator|nr:metalloregulator ArsR/SmtB family transcription factor [Polyangiaceae bacterium]
MLPWVERFRALADETRLLLLAALLDEELSVGELAEVVQAAQPGVSRHLGALREAGLVALRKQGTASFYRLGADEPLLEGPFGEALRRLSAEHKLARRVERVLARRRAKSQAFFDRADDWDTLRAGLFAESVGFASLLPLVAPGLTVADIGTGTGGMLPYLAEVADRIVAVDLSGEMLRRARARADELGLGAKVSFERGELEALPLESAAVDAAFASLVLHHAPRPAAALAEMARVVRPGGVVVVIDLVAHGHEWLRDEQADIWLGFGRDELLGLFARAGLADARHRVVSRVEPAGRGGAPIELFVASGRVQRLGPPC